MMLAFVFSGLAIYLALIARALRRSTHAGSPSRINAILNAHERNEWALRRQNAERLTVLQINRDELTGLYR